MSNSNDAKVVVEIGANNGNDTQRLADRFPNATIYAFEPTQELLINHLWPRFKQNDRVKILPLAIDTVPGFKTFNIAGQADWGCSSLHEFTDNIHDLWPGRPDFKVTHKYSVPAITMYDFCSIFGIDSIDYIWIDTQGNDLNCLKSFKDKIDIVKEGRCEVANKVELYKNIDNTYKSCHSWLKEKGFKVTPAYDYVSPSPEEDLNFYR